MTELLPYTNKAERDLIRSFLTAQTAHTKKMQRLASNLSNQERYELMQSGAWELEYPEGLEALLERLNQLELDTDVLDFQYC